MSTKRKQKDAKKDAGDFVELLDRWSKIAGLIAALISGIFFVSQSFRASVITLIVGWFLISSWLIRVYRRSSASRSTRLLSVAGIILLTGFTGYWSWNGVLSEIKRSSFPENSTPVPEVEYAGISIQVDSWRGNRGPCSEALKIITHTIDPKLKVQRISDKWVGEEFEPTWVILQMVITGKSPEDQIQVQNRIPLRINNYEPITKTLDVAVQTSGGCGGSDAYLVGVNINIPQQSSLTPGQIFWATYDKDILDRLAKLDPGTLKGMPTEIRKAVLNKDSQPPDVFFVSNNEKVLVTVAVSIAEPGNYMIQPGVEYIHDGRKSVAWVTPGFEVQVPSSFNKWQQIGQYQSEVVVKRIEFCYFKAGSGYECTNTP